LTGIGSPRAEIEVLRLVQSRDLAAQEPRPASFRGFLIGQPPEQYILHHISGLPSFDQVVKVAGNTPAEGEIEIAGRSDQALLEGETVDARLRSAGRRSPRHRERGHQETEGPEPVITAQGQGCVTGRDASSRDAMGASILRQSGREAREPDPAAISAACLAGLSPARPVRSIVVAVHVSRHKLTGSLEDVPLDRLLAACKRSLFTGTISLEAGGKAAQLELRAGVVDEARFGDLSGNAAIEAARGLTRVATTSSSCCRICRVSCDRPVSMAIWRTCGSPR
jgi:hypothetical protein